MRRLFFLSTFFLIAASLQDAAVDLVWKPKQNQVLDYSVRLDTKVEGEVVLFTADMNVKVAEVAENGDYTTETRMRKLKIKIGKEDTDLDSDEPSLPRIEKFDSRGKPLSKPENADDEVNPFSDLMTKSIDFQSPDKPVKKGDKWVRELKGDEKQGVKPVRLEYTYQGASKNLAQVTYTMKETVGDTPVTGAGTFLFDTMDYSLVSVEANIKNVQLEASTKRTSAKLSIKRN